MHVPSYRKHSSGQARVTINGKDHLLGKHGSAASKEAYGRLIAEFNAASSTHSFGKVPSSLKIEDVLLAYLRRAKTYYKGSDEYRNMKSAVSPLLNLYGSLPAYDFGAAEFKAVRASWLEAPPPKAKKDGTVRIPPARSRQYVNKQMNRTLRIVKWAVGEGLLPAPNYMAIKCVEPLRRGRCNPQESKRITCVDHKLVKATLPHLTKVVADMVRFQQLTGCRPGDLCGIKPGMVDHSSEIWTITLDEHKNAYRGKVRTIYVGPKAQAVLALYLLRDAKSYCFSPIESERQRRAARTAARVTPLNMGNRPGSNIARKPRKEPGEFWTTVTYGRAIKYACQRAKLANWAPNQLRHNAATQIRKQYGLDHNPVSDFITRPQHRAEH